MNVPPELLRAIRNRKVVLFVGSGVSRELGLPSWGGLIDELGRQLGFEPEVFNQYGNLLELAEFFALERGGLGDLSKWMDQSWHADAQRIDSSPIHQLIVDIDFPLIYTTNYDRWLEIAFSRRGIQRRKISSVKDMAGLSTQPEAQIVKFHGDFDTDDSLVFTEESYFRRLALDSPMDSKLKVDALGHSILFVGYSLADINLRYLFFKVWQLWTESQYEQFRPQSFLFLTQPNPIQERVLKARGIRTIESPTDDPSEGLRQLLQTLKDAL